MKEKYAARLRDSVDPLKKALALKTAKSRKTLPVIPKGNMELDYAEWQTYKLGIDVVASNIIEIFVKSIHEPGWLEAELAFEPYTHELFNFFSQCWKDSSYMQNIDSMDRVTQSRYIILDALRSYATGGVGSQDFWHEYLINASEFSEELARNPAIAIDLRLGSDLHTTPADASADADVTRDGLATRLDRLRDF